MVVKFEIFISVLGG